MILDVERYRYKRRKNRKRSWILLLVLAIGAAVGVTAWRLDWPARIAAKLKPEAEAQSLNELWQNRLYDELIARCDSRLQENPMETAALVYRGFAYFYKAVSEVTLEERIPFLDESIVSLRLSKLDADNPWIAETYYVLGKAYYHKGKFYYDLTLEYLQRALEAGYQREDVYDYLGLAATQLDRIEEGLEYFHKALEINPTDLLLLMIGKSYLQLERIDEAEEYLLRAVNKTEDSAVENTCRFLLGQLYFERQDYFKAENQYTEILALDQNSADAHYYLGEIYSKMNDPVRARAEWRKSLAIDPAHYGARLRYYR
jgi:tetratricopeptide (TPR) repeat protein